MHDLNLQFLTLVACLPYTWLFCLVILLFVWRTVAWSHRWVIGGFTCELLSSHAPIAGWNFTESCQPVVATWDPGSMTAHL